jgi:hypothetical protein
MKIYYLITLFMVAGFFHSVSNAETVYISSKQAKIYQEGNFSSQLVGKLKKSDSVEVVESKGIWIRVKNDNLSGWVTKYSVTSSPPIEIKVSIFARIKNFFRNENKRERIDLVSTAGGVRGLSEGEDGFDNSKNYEAVEQMESIVVSAEEVDQFISGSTN